MTFSEYLTSLRACLEAVEWSMGKTAQECWDTCERGDWMLWLIKRTMRKDEVSLRKLTLVKARCAKLVVHLMKDERSKNAVEVAERFGLGLATREELDAAARAADAAARAALAALAAADVATRAALAAALAAACATRAADAAFAAAHAADAATRAADAAFATILKQCSDIIRAEYPISPALVGLLLKENRL
jgi:hypothetical protein